MFDKNEMIGRVFKSPELTRKLIRTQAKVLQSDDNSGWYNKASIGNNEKQSIEIYSLLAELIDECRLNEDNMTILELVQKGYTFREISEKVNIDNSNISKRLNTMCRNIVKEYELQVIKEVANKAKGYFKKCTKCGENLPVLSEFFSYDKSNQCYKSSCKKCRRG